MSHSKDGSIDFLFQLLGWETSSEKDNPFSGVCKVLGLEYNLEETKLGTLIIKNTAKRIEDVSSEIDRALEENFLSAKDGERLRGRLNFMESQQPSRGVLRSAWGERRRCCPSEVFLKALA